MTALRVKIRSSRARAAAARIRAAAPRISPPTQLPRPRNTPEQKAAYERRERARHRDRRTDSATNYEMNERRREKDWRHIQNTGERTTNIILGIFGAGPDEASVVSEENIFRDLTRWCGPGASREARLEVCGTDASAILLGFCVCKLRGA